MRKIILSVVVLANALVGIAQEPIGAELLKSANTQFSELRYAYAIPLYKRYIQLNANDAAATLQLAKCYQINNQYDSAVKYTQLAASVGANVGNMLPELLANKGNYAAAVSAYQNNASALTKVRVQGFNNPNQFSKNALNYTIHYLAINTPFNEYAPVIYKDGLVFESNRAQKIKGNNEFGWDGSAYSKLYFTTNFNTVSFDSFAKPVWKEKSFSIAVSDLAKETTNDNNKVFTVRADFNNISFQNTGVQYFDEGLNSKFNVGAIVFSSDSTTAFFTKNQNAKTPLLGSYKEQKHLLEIWSANLVAGKWGNFKKLSFNNANASYFHPALSKNGQRLYFISDAVGGIGGTDLYYADKDAQGNWGAAVNAGDKVNTAGNELYPSIADGELYISSNGHAGLGGLDIYKVLESNGNITGVENVGSPVNSATDDMSYSKNGKNGFFVSNRYGTDDIFSFEYELRKVIIKGSVITSDDSKPVITVKLISATGVIATAVADAMGAYTFDILPGTEYTIEASVPEGYKANTTANAKDAVLAGKTYNKSIQDLVINIPAPVVAAETKKVTFNNIIDSLKGLTTSYLQLHHDFDKTTIVKGDMGVYQDLIKRVKAARNAKIVVISAADCMGNAEYNEKLSSRRADAITALVKIANMKNSFESIHLGKRVLVEPCDFDHYDMEYQKQNRYTYVFIIK